MKRAIVLNADEIMAAIDDYVRGCAAEAPFEFVNAEQLEIDLAGYGDGEVWATVVVAEDEDD